MPVGSIGQETSRGGSFGNSRSGPLKEPEKGDTARGIWKGGGGRKWDEEKVGGGERRRGKGDKRKSGAEILGD